jgi:hypothetical protein
MMPSFAVLIPLSLNPRPARTLTTHTLTRTLNFPERPSPRTTKTVSSSARPPKAPNKTLTITTLGPVERRPLDRVLDSEFVAAR